MKKIFTVFLAYALYFCSFNTAHAAIGGWTLGNPVAQGASAVYDATKTVLINGKNVVKTSTVKITPVAADVTKVLARTGVTLAMTVAVQQLLGSVDWVLDPANNQIVYTIPPTIYDQYEYRLNQLPFNQSDSYYRKTTAQVLADFQTYLRNLEVENPGYLWVRENTRVVYLSGTSFQIRSDGYQIEVNNNNRKYNYCSATSKGYCVDSVAARPQTVTQEPKVLPLSTVAAQVISNAETETDQQKKAAAQTVTMAAAADIVSEAETDNAKALPLSTALDANAVTPTSEAATGEATATDPTTGETETTDISLEFPVFCSWAPVVCEAAQKVVSIYDLIIANFLEPEIDKPQVPTTDLQQQEIKDDLIRINARSCPADIQFDVQGLPFGIQINRGYQMQPICNVLEPLKYVFHLITVCLCAFMLLRI